MTRPPNSAGELTVGSFRYGVDFVQRVRVFAPGSVSRQEKWATLKAPRLETYSRLPCGTGEAMKCSFDFTTHSTLGAAGPALPSVPPVRSTFPRYVAHGSTAGEGLTTEAQRHREARKAKW